MLLGLETAISSLIDQGTSIPPDRRLSNDDEGGNSILLAIHFQGIKHIITSLLQFIRYFICILGRAFASPQLEDFSKHVPLKFKDALLHSGISWNEFTEYVQRCPFALRYFLE